MAKDLWVTTVDNPFDPFSQWDLWYDYDEKMGYGTCREIAKLCPGSPLNLSDYEYEEETNQAIQTLCERYYPYEVWVPCIKGKTQRF